MRTKVLLCAAAVAALGAFSTLAQNVYSLNVVGYVNLPLTEGFNLVANQLDVDGTGVNNTVVTVFGNNLPAGSQVFVYDPVAINYNISTYSSIKHPGIWYPTNAWNPGQAAWVSIPTGAFGGQTQNVTTVGTVLQGALSNPAMNYPAGGFVLVASQIPLAGNLQGSATLSGLGYTPSVGDQAYLYDPVAINYNIFTYSSIKHPGIWYPNAAPNDPAAGPYVQVGQGFWMSVAPNTQWKTNFTIQ